MFDIIFPEKTDQRYWDIHYQYVLNIFKYLECNITYVVRPDFIVTINGQDFLIDFWDTSEVRESGLPTFKFHCHKETDKVFPFPSVSFYDWDQYYELGKEIVYNPVVGFDVSCRQTPYANAAKRRYNVQKMLKKELEAHPETYAPGYEPCVLLERIPQVDYWKEVSKIETAVFVPGFCNNMLDRGHLQYLAFGCYTISPSIPDLLPFGKQFKPKKHYVECNNDYSDVIALITGRRFHSNVEPFRDLGQRAKNLFKETCTPKAIGRWIKEKL